MPKKSLKNDIFLSLTKLGVKQPNLDCVFSLKAWLIQNGYCTDCSDEAGGDNSETYIYKTANYTTTTDDFTIDCNGTFTVTIVSAIGNQGLVQNIKNSGSGVITVNGTLGQTFDGSLTMTINPSINYTIQSTGSNWIII